MTQPSFRLVAFALTLGLGSLVAAAPAQADLFATTNLVSDGSVPAANPPDANLINPWGLSHSPTGPFWISDNGTGLTTIYNGAGVSQVVAGQTAITIAPPAGTAITAAPTGQVFNPNAGNPASTDFTVSSGGKSGKAAFIFATEDGTISGWAPGVNPSTSILAVDNSAGGAGAVYKGLALGSSGGQSFLYAANFRSGQVEMYNSQFQLVKTFTDPTVPAGYAPFNVQVLGGRLYVTFALQNGAKHDDVAGLGNGFVDSFDLNGGGMIRVASGGVLDSPWGLDLAPSTFGAFAGKLLVGNFGDGTINVFDPATDAFLGTVDGLDGQPLVIGDLWGLINGNGGAGGDSGLVYFTGGVADESGGVFGSLGIVPEPSALALLAGGLAMIFGLGRRRMSFS